MRALVPLTLLLGCGLPDLTIATGRAPVRKAEPVSSLEVSPPPPPSVKVAAKTPTPEVEVPSPFDRPADAVTPRRADAVAFELYRVVPIDNAVLGQGRAPDGVRVMSRSSGGTAKGTAFEIVRVPGETLAQTVARVRPWFEAIRLGPQQRWMFGLVRPPVEDKPVEVEVVEREPIAIHGADLEWIAARPGRSGGVEVMFNEAGRARVSAATAPIVGGYWAIAVADRMLWAPKFGGVMGKDAMPSLLAFIRDDAFGVAVRDAIAGDPQAIAALAQDRVTDGGDDAQVAAAKQAALPPAPVTDGTGRTHASFEMREGTRQAASMVLPAGFVLENRWEQEATWTRPVPSSRFPWRLELGPGCDGTCAEAELAANIEDECRALATPREREHVAERVTIVLDETEGDHRMCGRTVETTAKGDGGAWVDASSIELRCWVRRAGDDHFIAMSMEANLDQREPMTEAFRAACTSLRVE